MSIKAFSSRSSKVATTGKRPTNSGIKPNFSRSSGSTSFSTSPVRRSSGPRTSAPKPMAEPFLPRWAMIFSSPEKAPPHALARDVAGDGGVVGLATDLVDLVDIDDAALGPLDIVVGGLQQLQDDVLDILADIARFGQRRRIGHGEGHVDDTRQGLGEQRLAAARGPDQQDVRLRELDVVRLGAVGEALVVVMHCNREH